VCTATYAEVTINGTTAWGAGLDTSIAKATLNAVLSALCRADVMTHKV
jgi:2-isopropylmalate synthase